MKLLSLDATMALADRIYAQEVLGSGADLRYAAPETMPRIESRQVRAVAAALVEEVNKRLSALGGWDV